jgi:hypothetical protein
MGLCPADNLGIPSATGPQRPVGVTPRQTSAINDRKGALLACKRRICVVGGEIGPLLG